MVQLVNVLLVIYKANPAPQRALDGGNTLGYHAL